MDYRSTRQVSVFSASRCSSTALYCYSAASTLFSPHPLLYRLNGSSTSFGSLVSSVFPPFLSRSPRHSDEILREPTARSRAFLSSVRLPLNDRFPLPSRLSVGRLEIIVYAVLPEVHGARLVIVSRDTEFCRARTVERSVISPELVPCRFCLLTRERYTPVACDLELRHWIALSLFSEFPLFFFSCRLFFSLAYPGAIRRSARSLMSR